MIQNNSGTTQLRQL